MFGSRAFGRRSYYQNNSPSIGGLKRNPVSVRRNFFQLLDYTQSATIAFVNGNIPVLSMVKAKSLCEQSTAIAFRCAITEDPYSRPISLCFNPVKLPLLFHFILSKESICCSRRRRASVQEPFCNKYDSESSEQGRSGSVSSLKKLKITQCKPDCFSIKIGHKSKI